ncbi:MAG: ComF family protein [Oscillospiraceae bacterium]|nr:ComF family protein [Oscillospiraceae bacterium]
MTRVFTKIINAFFPPKCVLCGKIIKAEREEICADCRRELRYAADAKKVDFSEGAVCAVAYDGAVRDAFLRYKFSGQRWLADVFGELLAEAVNARLQGKFDVVTYAPLSAKRLRERGYDQARLLAEAVGQRLNVPVMPSLRKVKNTAANSSLDGGADARKTNVADAYEALAGIENRRFLLIDDVLTTGSTFAECAKTLLLGGAESVVCAAFAMAE